jgi:hypothetical protein
MFFIGNSLTGKQSSCLLRAGENLLQGEIIDNTVYPEPVVKVIH